VIMRTGPAPERGSSRLASQVSAASVAGDE